MMCRWCGGGSKHDAVRCLTQERDALKEYFREAVAALEPYLQSGGKYDFLMEPGQRITTVGPRRLVEFLEFALKASVSLQSHYAGLLNQYDGGERIEFHDAADWIGRLRMNSAERASDAQRRRS